jgi:hypothetical protein
MNWAHYEADAAMPPDDLARIRAAALPDQLATCHQGVTCDGPEWRVDTVRGHVTSRDVRRLVQVCNTQAEIIRAQARQLGHQPDANGL